MDYRIECYHQGADCLKFIHRYYLKTLGGPLQLVVVLVLYNIQLEIRNDAVIIFKFFDIVIRFHRTAVFRLINSHIYL